MDIRTYYTLRYQYSECRRVELLVSLNSFDLSSTNDSMCVCMYKTSTKLLETEFWWKQIRNGIKKLEPT